MPSQAGSTCLPPIPDSNTEQRYQMESESHGHYPVRELDAVPKRHPDDDVAVPEVARLRPRRFSHEPTVEEASAWVGWKATDEFGRSIGKVEDVYEIEGQPLWLLIRHKRSHHFLAPLEDAIAGGDQVFLPYDHETIGSAPEVDPGQPANEIVLAAARQHYASAGSAAEA